MTTTKPTELRHCTGSARFGIEPHEAPVSAFPKQPSRKDGLGTMCAEHWKAYVKGLTADRKARATAPEATASAKPAKPTAAPSKAKATTKKSVAKPAANTDAIAKAEAIIAEVDALPADQLVARVGDADVQRAFETVAATRGISME